MTPAAKRILDRMVALVQEPAKGWEAVATSHGSPTIRWTKAETTPDWAKEKRPGAPFALWEEDTYNTHVFLTLVAGKVIMRTSTAPWVNANDREIPFWLAEAVLDDPALGLDWTRQLRLKDERKAKRNEK